MNKKWITYGVSGAVGLALVAGAAAAAASTMDLRTTSGEVVPGGAITGRDGSVLDRERVTVRVDGSAATVVSAASPTQPADVASTASAPTPATPQVDSPASAWSAPEPVSAASPASVASAGSN